MHLVFASSHRRALAGSCACLLVLVACNTDPGKDQSHAEVSEPTAPVAAQQQAATVKPTGVAYAFSQAESKIAFVGAKVTGKHDGGFETFSGTIQLVDGDPEKSTVAVEIDNASITTDTAKLTAHLKSADFFDVARHPKTRFTSTQIKAGGADGATHTVTGNLDLHGVTKTITFPATIRVNGERVEVDADFAINRHDFGIVYAGMPDDLIKDNVLIKLTLRAGKTPQS